MFWTLCYEIALPIIRYILSGCYEKIQSMRWMIKFKITWSRCMRHFDLLITYNFWHIFFFNFLHLNQYKKAISIIICCFNHYNCESIKATWSIFTKLLAFLSGWQLFIIIKIFWYMSEVFHYEELQFFFIYSHLFKKKENNYKWYKYKQPLSVCHAHMSAVKCFCPRGEVFHLRRTLRVRKL